MCSHLFGIHPYIFYPFIFLTKISPSNGFEPGMACHYNLPLKQFRITTGLFRHSRINIISILIQLNGGVNRGRNSLRNLASHCWLQQWLQNCVARFFLDWWLSTVWPDAGLFKLPNVFKICLNNIHSSFYINWSFSK